MKKRFLISVAVLLIGSACAITQTKNNEQAVSPQFTQPIAEASPTPRNFFPPTSEDADEILKDSTEKLGIFNAQVMTLFQQPPEIVSFLAQTAGDADDPKNSSKWAEKISIVVGERDLNRDGARERIIVIFTDSVGNKTNPNAHFFWLKNGNWKWLTPQLLIDSLDNIKFVPTGKKGEFDIMRFRDKAADTDFLEEMFSESELNKWKDYVTDFRVKNEKYDFYECRVETGKAKKIIPCSR